MNPATNDTYSTTEVARLVGVHPNTIRKYEELGFITKPLRKQNGYRVFTDLQVLQAQLVRLAFGVELVQNNLRNEVLEIIRTAARCDFDHALQLVEDRHTHLVNELTAAERAAYIASRYESGAHSDNNELLMKRSEAAHYLSTTIDSLRNWEMNGLLQVKRKKNGYRVYNSEDLNRLSLIRTLRMGNYSLASIKRLLDQLETDPTSDARKILNTPKEDEDVVSVCDRLIISLKRAILDSAKMVELITKMKDTN